MARQRKSTIERITKETQIRLELNIDGKGRYEVSTGIRFFDHMLELFTKHGGFDLKLSAGGDLDVDQHHTVEDCGIALGRAFSEALGDKVGINRSGYFVMPMDETLAVVAVDLSGRPALVYHAPTRFKTVGDLQTELLHDFFDGFVVHCGANLHARVMYGRSNHHKIEAIFKCWAKALRFACSTDKRLKDQLPSTKGLLEKGS
jgi:imidazoleglycerol-phosphate dehydratase